MDIEKNCCEKIRYVKKKILSKKPLSERDFGIKNYKRVLKRCSNCGHYINIYNFNMNKIYSNNYSEIAYGDIKKRFNYLIKLKDKSDNFKRVERVTIFVKKRKLKNFSLLDIGSGFGIFPYMLKKKVKAEITTLEPNNKNAEFIKNQLKLKCKKKFFKKNLFKKKFDFITCNRVIEHAKKPTKVILDINNSLNPGGYFYIELPDAASAEKRSIVENEEFHLEHYHVFTKKSLRFMLNKNNFKIHEIKNITEKSGKFTVYAFAQKTKN